MPQFAANLTMMYPELPFLERFEAAAKDGFKAVEYLFPYAWRPQELAARLQSSVDAAPRTPSWCNSCRHSPRARRGVADSRMQRRRPANLS